MSISTVARKTSAPLRERVLLSLILALSLFLRLSDLDRFLTIDEPRWEERSIRFGDALWDDLGETYQSEHPGVVTMWIGASADQLAEIAETAAGSYLPQWRKTLSGVPRTPGIPPLTNWARRLAAISSWIFAS